MVFTKRHLLSNNALVEALQLPIPFEQGSAWLAQLIQDKAFIFETADNQITLISSLDSSVTIKDTGWIVKKEDGKIWLLSDERMNDFYVYAPGNATSEHVNLSASFDSVAVVEDNPVRNEELHQAEDVVQITEKPLSNIKPARARRTTRKVTTISQDV